MKTMKTIFEIKLEWYSNKSYLAKKACTSSFDINYACKRGPKLKPELKDKYLNAMVELWLIKEGEFTRDTLFNYVNN